MQAFSVKNSFGSLSSFQRCLSRVARGQNRPISREEKQKRSVLMRTLKKVRKTNKHSDKEPKLTGREAFCEKIRFTKIDEYVKSDSNSTITDEINRTIYIKDMFPRKLLDLKTAISNHREAAAPEMFNIMDSLILMRFWLDSSGRKQTKRMMPISGLIEFPNVYDRPDKNEVMVFTNSNAEAEKALNLGAKYSGGDKLLKQLIDKTITKEEVDTIICSSNFIDKLAKSSTIRTLLGGKFPTTINNTLGDDALSLATEYLNGIKYQAKEISDKQHFLEIHIGRLNMDDELILANYDILKKELSARKSYQKLEKFVLNVECHIENHIEKIPIHC